ncbi:MAG TPA: N-acetyltransferase [Dokdonella sp.]|uniref:GNAT family N-acetyltransferase n=1 Tax=Dokdonella sp. TaxID=2291710 RepID=UPI002D810A4C|nr:N-acetyltransferase [Dokdonella sp.]HET9033743.1 N-acetyltransferase [Dokdonella sp.]
MTHPSIDDSSLRPFPAATNQALTTRFQRAVPGCTLRPLHAADLPWLRDLYASSRQEEMAVLAWPDEAKRAFLDQQFAAQHQHFLSHYPDAGFFAIEQRGRGPAGRLYLQSKARSHLLIDICLAPSMRGQGIGSALIRQCQIDAAALNRDMLLHVHCSNRGAQQLYLRLGFVSVENNGSHMQMRWPAKPLSDQEGAASTLHVGE